MIYFEEYKEMKMNIDCNTIIALDIEVTSFWYDGNNIIAWNGYLSDEYYNQLQKGSCVYIWQIGITQGDDNLIFYGREWNDCKTFIEWLQEDFISYSEKDLLHIYVHNLSYEFCFIQNFDYEWTNVFARTMKKPMKATFENVEFRCSYFLTRLSIDSWGKQVGIPKMKGSLDYTKIRTPKTKMTKKELKYCEHDVLIMLVGLRKYRDKYGTIKKIPLTQTGEVRNVVKKMYHHEYGYHNLMTKLLPKTADDYLIAQQIFCGGDTHANVISVGEVISDVDSADETSEYPSVMFRYTYPNSPFKPTIERKYNFKSYCYIFCIKLRNVKSKSTLSYLSKSRCVMVEGGVYDNGRIRSAKQLCLYCTDIDRYHILKNYECEEEVVSVRKAIRGKLHKKYVEFILQLFKDKTVLKGVEGMTDLYLQQKQFLNSLYGMQVTSIVNPQIDYNIKDGWTCVPRLEQDIQSTLDELHQKKYKNILSFYHGCWVTSWARHDLWTILEACVDEGLTHLIHYYDTDSIKHTRNEVIDNILKKRNEEIIQQCETAQKFYGFESSEWIQTNQKSEVSILGTWDLNDGHYKKFKTLGAKKYMYEDDDGFHITISGVSKDGVKCLKNGFDDFNKNFKFEPIELYKNNCSKGLSTYLEGNNPQVTFDDGYVLNQPYGLNLRNIGYTLGLTQEFENIVVFMKERGDI